jgi:hypothetical protein
MAKVGMKWPLEADIKEYGEETYRHLQALISVKQEMGRALDRGASVEERKRLAATESREAEWATVERAHCPKNFK